MIIIAYQSDSDVPDHGTEVKNFDQVVQQYYGNEESGKSVVIAYESDVDKNRDTTDTHKSFSDEDISHNLIVM